LHLALDDEEEQRVEGVVQHVQGIATKATKGNGSESSFHGRYPRIAQSMTTWPMAAYSNCAEDFEYALESVLAQYRECRSLNVFRRPEADVKPLPEPQNLLCLMRDRKATFQAASGRGRSFVC
jgi:hypothetical protein